MASTKISALPAASTLTGAETIPLVQGGVTKKVTTDQFLTAANPSYTGTLTGGTGVVNLGSGQFVKDASGNLGLGVTPSVWAGGAKALQIGTYPAFGYSANGLGFQTWNARESSAGVFSYITTAPASAYLQVNNTHNWQIAPSGTAGNPISFTQAMTLDSAGDLTTTNGRINLITVGRGGGGVASNTASGVSALNSNTTGDYNTASGLQALYSNTTGTNNTASG
jgi:hypothetical protein